MVPEVALRRELGLNSPTFRLAFMPSQRDTVDRDTFSMPSSSAAPPLLSKATLLANIFTSIRQQDFTQASLLLTATPKLAKKLHPTTKQSLLHCSLAHVCPLEFVEELIAYNPALLSVQDQYNLLPIHMAVDFDFIMDIYTAKVRNTTGGTSVNAEYGIAVATRVAILSLLLATDPSTARMRDMNGRLPLHIAAWQRAPLAVVEQLLAAYPAAASKCTADGNLPIHLLARKLTLTAKDKVVVKLPEKEPTNTKDSHKHKSPKHKSPTSQKSPLKKTVTSSPSNAPSPARSTPQSPPPVFAVPPTTVANRTRLFQKLRDAVSFANLHLDSSVATEIEKASGIIKAGFSTSDGKEEVRFNRQVTVAKPDEEDAWDILQRPEVDESDEGAARRRGWEAVASRAVAGLGNVQFEDVVVFSERHVNDLAKEVREVLEAVGRLVGLGGEDEWRETAALLGRAREFKERIDCGEATVELGFAPPSISPDDLVRLGFDAVAGLCSFCVNIVKYYSLVKDSLPLPKNRGEGIAPSSDPFVKLFVKHEDNRGRMKTAVVGKTEVVEKNNINPQWWKRLDFELLEGYEKELTVQMYDFDDNSGDDPKGCVVFNLLEPQPEEAQWMSLYSNPDPTFRSARVVKGEIRAAVKYDRESERVEVFILEARGLAAKDAGDTKADKKKKKIEELPPVEKKSPTHKKEKKKVEALDERLAVLDLLLRFNLDAPGSVDGKGLKLQDLLKEKHEKALVEVGHKCAERNLKRWSEHLEEGEEVAMSWEVREQVEGLLERAERGQVWQGGGGGGGGGECARLLLVDNTQHHNIVTHLSPSRCPPRTP